MKSSDRQEQLVFILEQFQRTNINELLAIHPVAAVIAKKSEFDLKNGFVTKAEKSGYTVLIPNTSQL
jgi:hypothetical protein